MRSLGEQSGRRPPFMIALNRIASTSLSTGVSLCRMAGKPSGSGAFPVARVATAFSTSNASTGCMFTVMRSPKGGRGSSSAPPPFGTVPPPLSLSRRQFVCEKRCYGLSLLPLPNYMFSINHQWGQVLCSSLAAVATRLSSQVFIGGLSVGTTDNSQEIQ